MRYVGVHFIPYGSYVASCGYIEDQRYPDRQTDERKHTTCPECQAQMTDLGDLPTPAEGSDR
jgi:hypothetical protein